MKLFASNLLVRLVVAVAATVCAFLLIHNGGGYEYFGTEKDGYYYWRGGSDYGHAIEAPVRQVTNGTYTKWLEEYRQSDCYVAPAEDADKQTVASSTKSPYDDWYNDQWDTTTRKYRPYYHRRRYDWNEPETTTTESPKKETPLSCSVQLTFKLHKELYNEIGKNGIYFGLGMLAFGFCTILGTDALALCALMLKGYAAATDKLLGWAVTKYPKTEPIVSACMFPKGARSMSLVLLCMHMPMALVSMCLCALLTACTTATIMLLRNPLYWLMPWLWAAAILFFILAVSLFAGAAMTAAMIVNELRCACDADKSKAGGGDTVHAAGDGSVPYSRLTLADDESCCQGDNEAAEDTERPPVENV